MPNKFEQYERQGFFLVENFFSALEIASIREVVDKFHQNWISDNSSFYHKSAINSAYLTGTKYLEEDERLKLFQFVSSNKLMDVVSSFSLSKPAFMNTQLFFNPVNPDQKNYWHRDGQYHLPIEEQEQALNGLAVLHFRVALKDEPGIELVPHSHRRWDSEEELNVRLEKSGKRNFENLSTGQAIPLRKGDLLVFSANMLHRGLYGKDRLALDILFCEAQPEFFEFADIDCFPDEPLMEKLENPLLMQNAIRTMGEK